MKKKSPRTNAETFSELDIGKPLPRLVAEDLTHIQFVPPPEIQDLLERMDLLNVKNDNRAKHVEGAQVAAAKRNEKKVTKIYPAIRRIWAALPKAQRKVSTLAFELRSQEDPIIRSEKTLREDLKCLKLT